MPAQEKNYNFEIIKRDINSNSPENIGEASFYEQTLNYNGEMVISLTVNLRYNDLGRVVSEKHVAIGRKSDFNMIYTQYLDSQKKILAKKEGDGVSLTVINDYNNSYSTKHIVPLKALPSILLYLKLASIIGIQKEFDYIAYNENEFSFDKLVLKGKAVYKEIKEINIFGKKEQLHVFLNSVGAEKSIIYYDQGKELRAIEFVHVGQSIVFLRK